MSEKKQIVPRKRIAKKTTPKEEKEIEALQTKLKLRTYAEAKHIYFERKQTDAEVMSAIVEQPADKEVHKETGKRKCMTVSETKLGVTLVLSQADCKKIGYKPDTQTRDVIKGVRSKLGLEA